MMTIVLMGIENPGNLGAIARVMKNFNQKNLILIDPKCKKTDPEAKNRAKHAQDILKNAKTKPVSFLKEFDYLIATTASLGTDFNLARSPMTPEQFSSKIAGKKSNIAILIGRESTGLTNKEIEMCDFSVTIPSSRRYPTLNISHAVAIILYELSKSDNKGSVISHIKQAQKEHKQIITKNINLILNNLTFNTKEKKDTQRLLWKRVIAKSFLTKRESFAMIGFFKKVAQSIKDKKK